MKKEKILSPFILPGLLGIFLFYIVSFAESMYYAFTSGIDDRHFVGFSNFSDLMKNPAFLLAAKNTARFMLFGVAAVMILAVVVGWFLSDGSCSSVLYMLLVPIVVPSVAYLPGLRELLSGTGAADGKNLLQEQAFLMLLFVYVIKNLGYLVIVLYSAIREIPLELKEIYLLEKNEGPEYLFRVVIPLIRPSLLFCLIIAVMGCLKIYRESWLLFGDSPPLSVYMLQYFMNNNFEKLNYQRLSSAAVLLILVLAGVILLALHGGGHEEK